MTAIEFPILASKVCRVAAPMSSASEIGMGNSCQNDGKTFQNFGKISELRVELMCVYLRALYPERAAENVAADIGCKVDTARKWFEGVCAPSLIWFGRMIDVYGPELLAASMERPRPWLDLAARMAEQERLEAEIAQLMDRRRALA